MTHQTLAEVRKTHRMFLIDMTGYNHWALGQILTEEQQFFYIIGSQQPLLLDSLDNHAAIGIQEPEQLVGDV